MKNTQLFAQTVPAKLQTYLATGKPIISAISGEARDLLIQNDCGLTVNSEDKEALIDVFQNLDNVSFSDYEDFSKNSFKLYKEQFSSINRRKQLNKILFE